MTQTILPDPSPVDWRLPFMRAVLLSVTAGNVHLCLDPAELPDVLPEAGPPIALRSDTLTRFRRAVNDLAVRQGLSIEQRQRLLTGASEVAMNAVQHGGGGDATLRASPRTIQVWFRDRGATTGKSPAEADPAHTGYGWWLIVGTVDRVWLCPDPAGTVVVLEQERRDPDSESKEI